MLDEQEKQVLIQFIQESLKEKRRSRRWGIFFKLTVLFIVIIAFQMIRPNDIELPGKTAEHTALVKLEGIILAGTPANADKINSALVDAFGNEQAKAVILELNTPGGSPVQSARIYEEITRLRNLHPDKPIYAVIGDICASGGMFAASAASEIYANPASIIGSIGVIISSFGLTEAINRIGIERRLLTAGEHKAMLDPFLPQKPEEVAHVKNILDKVHNYFVDKIKEGRGDKLAATSDLFSGLIWDGVQAKNLGLIDAFGDVQYVAREIIKVERIEEYRGQESLLDRLTSLSTKVLYTVLAQIFFPPLM